MSLATKKADAVLSQHWDGGLPVNPIKIANDLNILVYKSKDLDCIVECANEKDSKTITLFTDAELTQHRFYAAHSLGHIVLGHLKDDTIKDDKQSFSSDAAFVEKEANDFAMALLMPERLIHTWFLKMIGTDLTDAAKMFDVSEAALYMRLLGLGLIKG